MKIKDDKSLISLTCDTSCLDHFLSSLPERIILHLLLKTRALYSKIGS